MPSPSTTQDVVKLRIAAQLSPRSWQRAVNELCDELEQGRDWQAAIESIRPKHRELGDLLGAALAAGHPASIVLEFMQQRSVRRLPWRQMLAAMLYPLGLVLAALLIGSLTSMAMMGIAVNTWRTAKLSFRPSDEAIFLRAKDFYDASVGGLLLVVWGVVLAGLVYFVSTPNTWLKLVGSLPILGRPYRWLELSELLTRISIFNKYQPSLDKTLSLTKQSYGRHALAAISGYLAHAIEQGEALPAAIHKTIISDARAGLALMVIEPNDLSGSARRASQLIDEMILATCHRLRLILPVFLLLIVGSIIWGVWSSYFELLVAFRELFYW